MTEYGYPAGDSDTDDYVRGAIELITTEELLRLPPASWLIQNLVPENGFTALYGMPGSGKSFVALDMAMCVSTGRAWLGRFTTKKSPVVYIAAEGGRGIQQRVRAWMQHYGVADLPAILFMLAPLHIRDEGVAEAFLDELTWGGREEPRDMFPGLIVVDTLSRCFSGGDENASKDMSEFVDRISFVAQKRRTACMVVHHTNAQGIKERGHTSLRGGVDTMLHCRVEKRAGLPGERPTIEYVEVSNTKQKDGEESGALFIEPILGLPSLVFKEMAVPPAPKGKKANGAGPAAPMRRSDMLLLLASHPDGLTWSEWRVMSGIPRTTFKKRLNQLVGDGEIYKDDVSGRYCIYPAGKDVAELEREEND